MLVDENSVPEKNGGTIDGQPAPTHGSMEQLQMCPGGATPAQPQTDGLVVNDRGRGIAASSAGYMRPAEVPNRRFRFGYFDQSDEGSFSDDAGGDPHGSAFNQSATPTQVTTASAVANEVIIVMEDTNEAAKETKNVCNPLDDPKIAHQPLPSE